MHDLRLKQDAMWPINLRNEINAIVYKTVTNQMKMDPNYC